MPNLIAEFKLSTFIKNPSFTGDNLYAGFTSPSPQKLKEGCAERRDRIFVS
jgi:hypothetical protein